MYFKVFDKDGKDITNDYYWVITQKGEVRYLHYDDFIGGEDVKAVLNLDDWHTEIFVSSWDEEG